MYQYSFANVDLILEVPDSTGTYEAIKIQGFGTGENLINITRKAPIAATQFGAYGDMVVSMQRIKAGDCTFPVLMNAPENEKLQDWANYFQQQADADGALIFPIQGKLVDNMGKDEVTMNDGVILAIPALSRGQTMSMVNWVITFEETIFNRKAGGDLINLGA